MSLIFGNTANNYPLKNIKARLHLHTGFFVVI
jgi:hypothetical protein